KHHPTLMLMSHLDVVRANPETWDVDPFSGKVVNGFLYGRGAIDTKSLVAIQSVALATLYSEDHEFLGTVKVMHEADEEQMGQRGIKWMIKNHPEKCKADLVLNEGGGQELPDIGGLKMKAKRPILLLETGCKGVFWIDLKIKGVAGHGSNPVYKKNPIMKMSRILANLYKLRMPIEITDSYKELVKGLPIPSIIKLIATNKTLLKLLLKNPDSTLSQLRVFVQTTISPNIVKSGSKENVIPDEGTITLDCRQLPGKNLEYLLIHLKRIVTDFEKNVEFIPRLTAEGNESPFNHKYYKMIADLCDKEYGFDLVPFMLPGAEDTLYLRPLGSICYGFCPMRNDVGSDILEMAHGKNERISLDNVYLGTDFYYKFIKKFSSTPGLPVVFKR
ncbi:MAG: M20/M25/M40 family metallo-hydrolase, partial [Promethearchaeota archaeon]